MAPRARSRAVRRVLSAALVLNAAVALAKILYGRFADSLSIEADGYHSLTDGVSSLVALAGVTLALRPPDARHPYGHRKLETLAAALVGVSLVLLALSIGGDALAHFRDASSHSPRIGPGAFAVLIVTLAVNLGVATYQARAGRRLSSELLASDAAHTRADCFVTLGVLAVAVLDRLGVSGLDVPAALAVAVLVGKTGADIVRENARVLTDAAALDPEEVRAVAMAVPLVRDAHGVRTRGTPDAVFVDLRVRVPGELTVREAARVCRRVARAIRRAHRSVVDVTIEPEPLDEER